MDRCRGFGRNGSLDLEGTVEHPEATCLTAGGGDHAARGGMADGDGGASGAGAFLYSVDPYCQFSGV